MRFPIADEHACAVIQKSMSLKYEPASEPRYAAPGHHRADVTSSSLLSLQVLEGPCALS